MMKLFSRIDRFLYSVAFKFDHLLTVEPTELKFPVELNEELSCSFQLTNKTGITVVYYAQCPWKRILESADEDTYVVSPDEDGYAGMILPESTCTVTGYIDSIYIFAGVIPPSVKAKDIARKNVFDLSKDARGHFHMPVVYYYTVPSASSCSAVLEENQKESLVLDDNNNLLSQSINDEIHKTTSEGEGSQSSVRRQLSNKIPSITLFSNYDIERATNGLSDSSKIGHGGYGTVYKGNIHDTEVAIKMLDSSSQQGIDEFLQEMEVLGRTRHPNLVKLIGACFQLRALVYEFLPHGSVEDCLKENSRLLTWQIRTRIVYDICSALTLLHSIKPEPVVHGDIKPANILLDAKFISKLADFGLCRFLSGGTATVAFLKTKNIKGTEWYIDPDFLETGELTPGCDVYSFGITMLRILTGAPAAEVYRKVERAIRKKSLMAMVDSTAGEWPENVAEFLAYMGLECCGPERKSSKLMKDISTGLEDILAKIDT